LKREKNGMREPCTSFPSCLLPLLLAARFSLSGPAALSLLLLLRRRMSLKASSYKYPRCEDSPSRLDKNIASNHLCQTHSVSNYLLFVRLSQRENYKDKPALDLGFSRASQFFLYLDA
jgi:hypothetical protein